MQFSKRSQVEKAGALCSIIVKIMELCVRLSLNIWYRQLCCRLQPHFGLLSGNEPLKPTLYLPSAVQSAYNSATCIFTLLFLRPKPHWPAQKWFLGCSVRIAGPTFLRMAYTSNHFINRLIVLINNVQNNSNKCKMCTSGSMFLSNI